MHCDHVTHQLDAFVDGECLPEDEQAIREHLKECSDCRGRADALAGLNAAISENLGSDKAPSDLWDRIETRFPEVEDQRPTAIAQSWYRRQLKPLALAASIAVLLALPAGFAWWRMQTDMSVVSAPIKDFVTYQVSERDLDIRSGDPGEIRSWFEGKLAFEAPPIRTKIAGFELTGARLCWFLDRRISALAYQRGEETISLYVMADHDLALPEARFEPRLDIRLSSHEVDDISNLIWHEDGLVYTVVSDLKTSDLTIFLAALARFERAATNAPFPLNTKADVPPGAAI